MQPSIKYVFWDDSYGEEWGPTKHYDNYNDAVVDWYKARERIEDAFEGEELEEELEFFENNIKIKAFDILDINPTPPDMDDWL